MTPTRPSPPPRAKGRRRVFSQADPLTSVMLVFPLFIAYQIGVLCLPGVYNGADLITSEMLRLLHGNQGLYLIVNLGLAAAFLLLVLVLRRNNHFDAGLFVPVLLESAVYALTMGSLICFVMVDVLHVNPSMAIAASAGGAGAGPPGGLLERLVLSLGAGVHEELLFRLGMVGGGVWLLNKGLGLRRWLAIVFAVAVSSVLFSAAHHIIGGEPWRLGAFVYRILCGVFFAVLFQTRGFAVAVYTHALYDIYVLFVRG
jgi:hypothetical protein